MDASAPVSSCASCPRLSLGSAAAAPGAWGVSASPFPLGNTARTPVCSAAWLFQSTTAARQLRGAREKHAKGRWDKFIRLEEAVEGSALNKYQEGGNKPITFPKYCRWKQTHNVPKVSRASITSPPGCQHFGGFADTKSLGTLYPGLTLPMKDLRTKGKNLGRNSGSAKGHGPEGREVSTLPCRSQNQQHVRHEECSTQKS